MNHSATDSVLGWCRILDPTCIQVLYDALSPPELFVLVPIHLPMRVILFAKSKVKSQSSITVCFHYKFIQGALLVSYQLINFDIHTLN